MSDRRQFFIVGSQGIPASYGGLETFAHELSVRLVARGHPTFVTCERAPGEPHGPDEFQGVRLLYVEAPANNFRTMVADRKALLRCGELARRGDVVCLLGYGVGPFARGAIRKLRRKGVEFWLNPDGLEWKRPRWPWYARRYLRWSEGFLLREADRVICDAAAIRDFHEEEYGIPAEKTEVIEYGAPVVEEIDDPEVLARRDAYLERYGLRPGEYYTYVGRFVPDNNMELMVRGVLDARVERRLLVFAAHDESDPFYRHLDALIRNSADPDKVILTGGVYDQPLLEALRKGEFAYFHGHEVGGTNPALVEAMGLGSFIIARGTVFNREVLRDAALYFEKDVESFVQAILRAEALDQDEVAEFRRRAVERVRTHYNWERITDRYEELLGAGAPVSASRGAPTLRR